MAAIAAAAIVGPLAPAYAGGEEPFREEDTSPYNGAQVKSVTVECPDGTFVFAAGGKIDNGNGGVVLTAVLPTVNSVTATGAARTGYSGDWSVTAYAVCDESDTAPEQAVATASAAAAVATCDPGLRIFGTGFRLDAPADHAYINEVAPDVSLRNVRVHAGGDGVATGSVTAIGICHSRATTMGRDDLTVDLDGTWPKAIAVENTSNEVHVYGAGGRVVGSPRGFIDALIPDVKADRAGIQVALASIPGGPNLRVGAPADGDDERSGTAYTVLGGAFH